MYAIGLAGPRRVEFREHTIATDLTGGYQVVACDVNHDGKPDLIALASGMTELVWYENPTWERHVIARNLPRMINLAAWDTDGDGIPEIVLAHEFSMRAKDSIGHRFGAEAQRRPARAMDGEGNRSPADIAPASLGGYRRHRQKGAW